MLLKIQTFLDHLDIVSNNVKKDRAGKWYTVNSEIFARILFSRIGLKDIFVTLKVRDLGII